MAYEYAGKDPLNDDDKEGGPYVESNASATKFLMTGVNAGWPGGGRGGSPSEGTASPGVGRTRLD